MVDDTSIASRGAWLNEPLHSTGTDNSIKVSRPMFDSISAITLATHDMPRAVAFYEALGFERTCGGSHESFTSFQVGEGFLNLIVASSDQAWSWWGRVILHVTDVDGMYARALAAGLSPQFAPRDAPWGERYFHLTDPDGHELSFARPICRDA